MTTPYNESTEEAERLREEVHNLRHELQEVRQEIAELSASFSTLVASHNAVGENLQWLVANTQGIFQMFNNPQMMSEIMGKFMGGGAKVGG